MTIQRIDPGPRMSEAVIHNDTIYLAGQIGDPASDAAGQTREALAEIDALLARCGSSKAKILSATVWLADIADFDAMNTAWDAWVDPAHPPARATGEARLFAPGYKVEIIVVAAR
ncbi:MAG TPA: RidA family protein [Novosphingobium sp.]|nr:RidA family protein [Novosphingobium sp.]